jgi:hypothetical protein
LQILEIFKSEPMDIFHKTQPIVDPTIEVISAGLHHVATLQGTNPLTFKAPPVIMAAIEQDIFEGCNIPDDMPPTAATFATHKEHHEPRIDRTTVTEGNNRGGGSLLSPAPAPAKRTAGGLGKSWEPAPEGDFRFCQYVSPLVVHKSGRCDCTVAQKIVPMFCHFEQTCTSLTLTPKPALEKNRGDSTASYLQFGALHARFRQKLTEK